MGDVHDAEGATAFTLVAADGAEVTVSLTRTLVRESLYLQAALDAGETRGVVPVARGSMVAKYVSYMHFRALLTQLRCELHPALEPHSLPPALRDNDWVTQSEQQRLSHTGASYEDAPLSCDGGPRDGYELPSRALLTRWTARGGVNDGTMPEHVAGCATPHTALSAPLTAAIEDDPVTRTAADDDDCGYALHRTLDDYADVFFVEKVLLQRPQECAEATPTYRPLSAREQQLVLELLVLGDFMGDQHLVRLCAHYFCCWLMSSTEADLVSSFLPSAQDPRFVPTYTLSQLLHALPPHTPSTDAAPSLTPDQRLALLQHIRRTNAAHVTPDS